MSFREVSSVFSELALDGAQTAEKTEDTSLKLTHYLKQCYLKKCVHFFLQHGMKRMGVNNFLREGKNMDNYVFDRAKAITRLGEDEELFREIIGVFLEEYPKMMASLQKALEDRDSKLLQRMAHTIKGSVSNFCAEPAFEAAFALEMVGKEGNFSEAQRAFSNLKKEVDLLVTQISAELKTGKK